MDKIFPDPTLSLSCIWYAWITMTVVCLVKIFNLVFFSNIIVTKFRFVIHLLKIPAIVF